ncbi:nitroreductase family protein [Alistipes sp.]|uniref:nitroreductase family protein n=1 Tax=Alistipes sp. TaxID=1872444 RepID=UPI003AF17114
MKTLLLSAALLLMACGTRPARQVTATPVEYDAEIALLTPDSTGGLPIDEALWKRATSRDFTGEALTLEELSGVVWAAAGINRPDNNHLTAPSALALYPIRVYAFLPGGVYRYDQPAHRLVRVVDGDHRALAGTQPFVATALLNLVYVADLSVYDGRDIPAEHIRYLCGQDAAGYAENANLYAAGHGLKSVTRGSAPAAELLALLNLDPERYFFALAQSVGK